MNQDGVAIAAIIIGLLAIALSSYNLYRVHRDHKER